MRFFEVVEAWIIKLTALTVAFMTFLTASMLYIRYKFWIVDFRFPHGRLDDPDEFMLFGINEFDTVNPSWYYIKVTFLDF